MRKIADYKITEHNPYVSEANNKHPINVTIWEHLGNRIEITFHPIGGYFAFINNNKQDFGHSRPDDPIGIILYVLMKLGIPFDFPK